MKSIILFLYFPRSVTLMKRVWDLTASPEKDSFPHPFVITSRVDSHLHDLASNHLNYPHTGDVHTLTFKFEVQDSHFEVTFRSRRTITSGIIIWGEVLSTGFKGHEPFETDISSIERLRVHGWRHASREETNEWKSII